tara:strand:- start:24 stop:257 length:234 start_codon:yes stop_codon:yes gene_type:complete
VVHLIGSLVVEQETELPLLVLVVVLVVHMLVVVLVEQEIMLLALKEFLTPEVVVVVRVNSVELKVVPVSLSSHIHPN